MGGKATLDQINGEAATQGRYVGLNSLTQGAWRSGLGQGGGEWSWDSMCNQHSSQEFRAWWGWGLVARCRHPGLDNHEQA